MTSNILIFIILVILLGYIIFLHIQLTRKNIFIETTVRRLSEIESNWSAEEMMKFLREIRRNKQYSSFFSDKLFDEKPMKFLLSEERNSRIFIHYTRMKEDAENILKTGFIFADSFYKTAQPVTSDRLDILIKHNTRKSFGDYLIVLSISDKLFHHYASILDKENLKEYSVENLLTETPPFINDNGDLTYQLSKRFVKGYINHQTGEIVANPEFNPANDSPAFENNINIIKSGQIK